MPGFYLSAPRLASVSGKSSMKAYGKGQGISLAGITKINTWKQGFNVSEGVPVVEFRPLSCWPAHSHPRQAEIDAFLS